MKYTNQACNGRFLYLLRKCVVIIIFLIELGLSYTNVFAIDNKQIRNTEDTFFARNSNSTIISPSFIRTGLRSVTLNWNSIESADYYEVYINDGGLWRRKNKLSEPTVSYNFLICGREYEYKIRAHIMKNGTTSYTSFSQPISFILEDFSTNIHAQITSRKKVLLSWDEVPGSDYYEIYRKSGNIDKWIRKKIVYGVSSAELATELDTQYQYKIRAHINHEGYSFFGVFSNPISVSYSVPSVSNFQVNQTGFTTFTLKWDSIENSDYYEIYRQIGETGTWTRNKKITDNLMSYSLRMNNSYSFKVRAHISLANDSFYTPFTEVLNVSVQIPSMNDVVLNPINTKKFLLSWDVVANTDYYEIFRLTGKNGEWRRNQVIYNELSKEYSIKPGELYGFKLRARLEKDGERIYTSFSDPIYLWETETPVLSVKEMSNKHLQFSWTNVPLADKYYIYANGSVIGESLETSYCIDSAFVGSEISVSPVLVMGDVEIESDLSESILYEVPNEVNYRALVIGESAYSTRLNGPYNDINFMGELLNQLSNQYNVTTQQDATLEEIVNLIEVAFEGADENDVSLFYYSGHGVTGSNDYYSGALQTVDYKYISTMDLAELLSDIPGRVIVILDSCGSGAMITEGSDFYAKSHFINTIKSTVNEEEEIMNEELTFDPVQFNDSVVEAFSAYDSTIFKNSSLVKPGGPHKAGELKQTKFHVITSSAYEENSLTTQVNGVWGGVLTRGIAEGVGSSYPEGEYLGFMPADSNSDDSISFSELSNYCQNYASDKQHVLSYSSSPGYLLFMR